MVVSSEPERQNDSRGFEDLSTDITPLTKLYTDSDLNESPLVVLGCGHVFLIKALDDLLRLKVVYEMDTGCLIEETKLIVEVPRCPYCRIPIRQYTAQRYNRLVNKTIIDVEMKHAILSRQQELQDLEGKLDVLRLDMERSRPTFVPDYEIPDDHSRAARAAIEHANKHSKQAHGQVPGDALRQYTSGGAVDRSSSEAMRRTAPLCRQASSIRHERRP
jgi:hypothetical protein